MKMHNVLVCALADAARSPRPRSVINACQSHYDVSYMGYSCSLNNVKEVKISKRHGVTVRILRAAFRLFKLHDLSSYISYSVPVSIDLSVYDTIVCHDLELLPYIYKIDPDAKVIFDAREFYPRHFENSYLWRIFQAPFQDFLCRRYLHRIHSGTTVSTGLQLEYQRRFDVDLSVIYSYAPFETCAPIINSSNHLSLIHHGNVTNAREIERMIIAMDFVKRSATLDLMLVGTNSKLSHLKRLINNRSNVRLLDPVPYTDIVNTINKYDVGIVFFPPSTFNLKHCMPNKLFEYIQARLAIVAAPLFDLSEFITEHNIGIVAQGFEPEQLASAINTLDNESISDFKHRCNELAPKLSQNSCAHQWRALVEHAIAN